MNQHQIHTESDSLLAAGAALVEARTIQGHPFLTLPDGVKVISLEKQLAAPLRRTGNVVLRDVASFVRYVNDEKIAATRIYGSYENAAFVAVFHDHKLGAAPVDEHGVMSGGAIEPGWKDYRATYACPLSAEWKAWIGSDKKKMTQVAFSEFIEANYLDIRTPTAAEMLEVATGMEASKNVKFSSGIKLTNGEHELSYSEEINATTKKGKLAIPEEFKLAIPVLEGGDPYEVIAKLRYRIAEGGLTIWYELLRPHKVIEAATKDVWTAIEAGTTAVIFNGAP